MGMKKTKWLLLLSALTLTGCDLFSVSNAKQNADKAVEDTTTETAQNSQNNTENTGENTENTNTNSESNTNTNTGDNTETNTENTGSNTGDNTGTETNTGTTTDPEIHTNEKIDPAEHIPDNTPYSLSDWTNFTWHDGREPDYCDGWDFYYGTSHNPNGCLWTNPNTKANYSGVELKKDTLIISPAFESWSKIEVRFTFWFNSHSSNSYQAANNKPQFLLQAYDNKGSLLSTDEIEISRSDVPTNNTPKEIKTYIREPNMYFFVLKFNNFIPNGSTGYTAILCDASLKGWPYN